MPNNRNTQSFGERETYGPDGLVRHLTPSYPLCRQILELVSDLQADQGVVLILEKLDRLSNSQRLHAMESLGSDEMANNFCAFYTALVQ